MNLSTERALGASRGNADVSYQKNAAAFVRM
jgi:hypothetical protein